ncbi:MAG: YceD family protein [Erysipelotrichaceae bacterium]|nr:YceD family protein [Erysipelotrichaceae bacterium]
MKWSKAELLKSKEEVLSFHETISFPSTVFAKMDHIRGLQDVTVSGSIDYNRCEEKVFVDLSIEGVMILPCSITLEDVEYAFQTNSLEIFSFEKVNDEDVHETKGDVVELMPVVFSLILMEVPFKVVKSGVHHYPKGEGWEVVKEEDYAKTKERAIDPRLAKLKEFKVEE